MTSILCPATQRRVDLEQAIITDLHDYSLTYVVIAVRHGVGVARIAALAKANDLTRVVGKREDLPQQVVTEDKRHSDGEVN